jgi:hypothetical protein
MIAAVLQSSRCRDISHPATEIDLVPGYLGGGCSADKEVLHVLEEAFRITL